MKFFVVFLTALVLILGENGEARGYAVEVGDLEEAGDVNPQAVYAEESPAIRVFDPEDLKGASAGQDAVYAVDSQPANREFVPPSTLYIPTVVKACTDSACAYICSLLGFQHGVCISSSTCQCSN